LAAELPGAGVSAASVRRLEVGASAFSSQALSPVDVYAESPQIQTAGVRAVRRLSSETARPLAVFSSRATQDRLQWLLEKLESERDRHWPELETLGAIAEFLGPKIAEIEDAHPFMTAAIEGIDDALINISGPLRLLDRGRFEEAMRNYLRSAIQGTSGRSYWEESERLFLQAHAEVLSGTALQGFLMGASDKRLKDLRLWRKRSSNSDIDGVLRLAHATILAGAFSAVGEKMTQAAIIRMKGRRPTAEVAVSARQGAQAAHVRWNLEQALPTGGWLAVMPGVKRFFLAPGPSPAVGPSALGFLRSA